VRVLAAGGTSNHSHVLIVLPSDTTAAKAVQVLHLPGAIHSLNSWHRPALYSGEPTVADAGFPSKRINPSHALSNNQSVDVVGTFVGLH
jgi:hypothetical protein